MFQGEASIHEWRNLSAVANGLLEKQVGFETEDDVNTAFQRLFQIEGQICDAPGGLKEATAKLEIALKYLDDEMQFDPSWRLVSSALDDLRRAVTAG